jgi:SAM-dependent methyltransferase
MAKLTDPDYLARQYGDARNLAAGPGRFLLTSADAQRLPFPDDYFDGVLANHMLYHVPDRARALREIRRALRPGGRLYASTVGEQHMAELSRSQLARRFGIDLGAEQAGGALSGGALSGGAPSGPAAFSLENGGDQLEYLFTNVRLYLYEDWLEVDNAAALVGYVNSIEKLDEGAAARLRQAPE